MRMSQSINQIEEAFAEEAALERARAEALQRKAQQRTSSRHRDRRHKQGSLRFWLLVLVLIATAVGVTVAMFETLYLVMG
jgi:anti-sigma-K factor RskA